MKTEKVLNSKGFTLIELLVVTAIIGVLGVTSAQIITSVLRSQQKTEITNEVRQNGDQAINLFERDVRSAIQVCSPGGSPCGGSTLDEVELTLIDRSTVIWRCFGLNFTRDGLSVMNNDLQSGVNLVPGSCWFDVTTRVADSTQLVTLHFDLEQSNPVQRQEYQVQVPFSVSVSTRSYGL